MKHFADEWIKEWCTANGWTDLFVERCIYWAFPPHGVIPLPIPKEILVQIKAEKGFSPDEKKWLITAMVFSFISIILAYLLRCPMPLVLAFAFSSIVVGKFELE